MSESAEISIGAPTIAIPQVATGRTNALPTPATLLGTSVYHFNRRRPTPPSAVPAPDLAARGTERFAPPRPMPDNAPVPADIEVQSTDGEVRLQVGTVAIRCSASTATWIARALLEAARTTTPQK